MPRLPTGTVTFLFTDIEGSTQLLHEHGEHYAELLAEHRRVLRDAFGRHGGVEVDTQGDAFFVAFASAREAAAAATEAQRGLESAPIRVRMGLHTGEATVTDEGYVGIDVHRAARIAAAGHGGQVLLSQSTRDLTDDDARDLGDHRLKDLSAPERLYQLGDGEFPPLKTLYQTNLPVPATTFLGRESEVADVTARLAGDQVRLLTLTGPGGTGKTRLALQASAEVAETYEHGVWWVPLAPLRDARLVLESGAQVLGAKRGLAEHIGPKRLLLLFDNFEHLLEAGPGVAELLHACPQLNVLVTSREPLHVTGEWEYAVDPLREDEAVLLFIERARAAATDFSPNPEVGEICRRVDCLPLAIELAAARVKVLSPAAILERLGQRLPLLSGGVRDVPKRQRTLRATIEWSYDLLSRQEQRLFARLAVFSGGCTIEAAEQVCGADLDALGSLVDKSLVRRNEDRYWMLETIREYALERLDDTSGGDDLRQRHAEWFGAFAEAAAAQRDAAENIPKEPEGPAWFDRLDADLDNMRTAMAWGLETGHGEVAVEICIALRPFWFVRDHVVEARRWLGEALPWAGRLPEERRALALRDYGSLSFFAGDNAAAERAVEEALPVVRSVGRDEMLISALNRAGNIAQARGDYARARALYGESLSIASRFDDPKSLHQTLHFLGELERDDGNFGRALEILTESAAGSRQLGNTSMLANTVHGLGDLALDEGSLERAGGHYRESLLLFRQLGSALGVAYCLAGLAAIAAQSSQTERAARLWAAAQRIESDTGRSMMPWERRRYEPYVSGASIEVEAPSLDDAIDLALSVD